MSSKANKDHKDTELIRLIELLNQQRQSTFERFPLLFTLLITFGTVLMFTGASRISAKISLIYDNPYITLGVGILVLLFTGTLYKKL